MNLLFLHDRIEHARPAPTCDYSPLKTRVVIDIIRLCFYLFLFIVSSSSSFLIFYSRFRLIESRRVIEPLLIDFIPIDPIDSLLEIRLLVFGR